MHDRGKSPTGSLLTLMVKQGGTQGHGRGAYILKVFACLLLIVSRPSWGAAAEFFTLQVGDSMPPITSVAIRVGDTVSIVGKLAPYLWESVPNTFNCTRTEYFRGGLVQLKRTDTRAVLTSSTSTAFRKSFTSRQTRSVTGNPQLHDSVAGSEGRNNLVRTYEMVY